MILGTGTKVIRIIPTKSPIVLKLVIQIGQLSPYFLQELGVIFLKDKIATLYSTGLCFTQETCVYEGFIDAKDLKVTPEQLRQDTKAISGVTQVTLEELTPP
jgi:hypothetical protein